MASYKAILTLCVEMSDPIAAIFLYRLRYWLLKSPDHRDGFIWVANPRSWWASQTGLTPNQIDRAVIRLRKAGILIVEAHPQKYWGIMSCRWIRLSDTAVKTLLPIAEIESSKCVKGVVTTDTFGLSPQSKSLLKDSSKEKESSSPTQAGGTVGNFKQESKKQEKEIDPLLKQALAVEEIWKTLVQEATGTVPAEFTKDEILRTQFFLIDMSGKSMPVAEILKRVVFEWDKFAALQKKLFGKNLGPVPEPTAVMKYPNLVLDFVGLSA